MLKRLLLRKLEFISTFTRMIQEMERLKYKGWLAKYVASSIDSLTLVHESNSLKEKSSSLCLDNGVTRHITFTIGRFIN